ncbi:MAG: integrin alpha, partial [Planctomycetota bacterium]
MEQQRYGIGGSVCTCVALTVATGLVGGPAGAQCKENCTAIHTLVGEQNGDQYGWVSNDVGDLDGDQVTDFVLTAPTNDAAGNNAGRVYAYSGATGEELWRVTGAGTGWW